MLLAIGEAERRGCRVRVEVGDHVLRCGDDDAVMGCHVGVLLAMVA